MQNGVDAADQLVSELGYENVIGGLCRIVSYVVGPGHIRHAGFKPSIIIGELDNRRTDPVVAIEQMLKRAGVEITIAADMQTFKSRSGPSFFLSRRLVELVQWPTRPPQLFAAIRSGARK
jgi:ketopantoate reductase